MKNYLVDSWHIDPSRISIKSQNLPDIPSNIKDTDGIQENRRVEILANNPKIFETYGYWRYSSRIQSASYSI